MSKIHPLNRSHSQPLGSPATLKQELPAQAAQLQFIQESRRHIGNILDGSDPRLLLIVGPCSIHDVQAAKEYAHRLRSLAEETAHSFFIVMRTYFEKPRTSLGWKGMLYDPHLDSSHDITTGIRWARHLLLDLAAMNIPTATEFLDPLIPQFFEDLISWSCIGARTSESQIHRQLASSLSMPVAFKNSTSGNIGVAINGIIAAATSHAFLGVNDHGHLSAVHSTGNPYAHIALRGGENGPNYDEKSIAQTLILLKQYQLPQRIIVDCAHDNSNRCHHTQKVVFGSVIQQFLDGNTAIRGLCLESHLFEGTQSLLTDKSRLQYAVSVTDPCLDWQETETLIRHHAAILQSKQVAHSYSPTLASCTS